MTDYKQLCAELLAALESWSPNGGAPLEEGAEAIAEARLIERARAALSQPEPAGLSDEELLKALKLAINSFPPAHPDAEGMSGAQYEVTLELRKARAVEAATLARAQRQPQPPEPGEVQELVKWLREQEGWMGVCAIYSRIAELLSQRHPQPADLSDEKIEAIFDKHGQYVYDSEEDMGAKVIFWGDFKTAAREIESPTPVAAPHQPVPVSERPWEREGWCDDQGKCWWFNPGQPAMSNPHIATSSWRLCRMLNGKPMGAYSLPAHALPLPGEVEG